MAKVNTFRAPIEYLYTVGRPYRFYFELHDGPRPSARRDLRPLPLRTVSRIRPTSRFYSQEAELGIYIQHGSGLRLAEPSPVQAIHTVFWPLGRYFDYSEKVWGGSEPGAEQPCIVEHITRGYCVDWRAGLLKR